jgi:ribosomal protein S18 acetylase RimI-like enzyme
MDTGAERAHRNLCDYVRWNIRLDAATVALDESGIVAFAGKIDFPTARTAVRSDRTLPAARWVDTVDGFFSAHGNMACVYARQEVDDDITERLLACGFHEWATTPEMVCDHELGPRDPEAGVTVRFADTPADISAYAAIAAEAFAHLGIPAAAALDSIDHPDAFLADDCAVAVAEVDGTPVAGAQVVLVGGDLNGDQVGGYVAWVSCADAARGRGLGDTVTRAVTNEAFRRGADFVSLEASQFGEHTYARMGYREIYRYRMLIRVGSERPV